MPKTYRRTIRINGHVINSPRFQRASDADKWYQSKLREKQFAAEGLSLPVDIDMTLSDYFENTWLSNRKKKYPKATWLSDQQRFRKYVAPEIGKAKVSKISQLKIREVLRHVVDDFGQSIQTRNRVRSLLSKIFNDSMNESPPLRRDNPAYNISFDDPRVGKKEPNYIRLEKDISKFVKAARSLGTNHYVYVCIMLMAALRKSEMIPLKWNDFDENESELLIDEKFEQASNSIKQGTKAGSEQVRVVPIPDDLVMVLKRHRAKSDWQDEGDFILCREDGSNFGPREIHELHNQVVVASGVSVTPHGLRHTYGRQFVLKDGNMKALQAIMGHSSSSTTDLYSKLAGKSVKQTRNTLNLGLDDDE